MYEKNIFKSKLFGLIIIFLGEGHRLRSLKVWKHLLHKGTRWLHNHWKSFEPECTLTTTTTATTTSITYPTTKKGSKPSGAASIDLGGYLKAAIVLIAMQCFTLSIWYQLKI